MRKLFKNNVYIINIMSSRSLAAARAKRAGENTPMVSGNRPITSIASQAAFSPPPPQFQQNQPQPAQRQQQPSIQQRPPQQVPQRVPQQPPQRQQPPPQQQFQPPQQQFDEMVEPNNVLPSKISIPNAIGFLSYRLGRLEKWVMDTENEMANSNEQLDLSNLPENSSMIDNDVLNELLSKIDALENSDKTMIDNASITNLSDEINNCKQQLVLLSNEVNTRSAVVAKHTEQLFKFERDLLETKDMLKTFMIKYDMFASEINTRFEDYEVAISELEKNVQLSAVNNEDVLSKDVATEMEYVENNDNVSTIEENSEPNGDSVDNIIMTVDLKTFINQELAAAT